MSDIESIAWVARVAWLFDGLVFWKRGRQALILPGYLWRTSRWVS